MIRAMSHQVQTTRRTGVVKSSEVMSEHDVCYLDRQNKAQPRYNEDLEKQTHWDHLLVFL
jgi:hypothetical protein